MGQLKFLDDTGDKKYFTIIPNYIVNHSTAIDQALYIQMKRIAGEGGTCEAGYRYFIKQMDIGYKAYKKSISYLLEHKWIDYLGKKRVQTEGGVQSIASYRVNDIWQLNNEYYKGGAESKPLMPEGGAESEVKVVLKGDEGGAESKQKKNRSRTKEEEQMMFNKFWTEYPKKIGKEPAFRSWCKLSLEEKLMSEIMAGLKKYKQTDQWQKENGKYIPHPTTWLNQKRWEDEIIINENPIEKLWKSAK